MHINTCVDKADGKEKFCVPYFHCHDETTLRVKPKIQSLSSNPGFEVTKIFNFFFPLKWHTSNKEKI